jgi:hypothetical protein
MSACLGCMYEMRISQPCQSTICNQKDQNDVGDSYGLLVEPSGTLAEQRACVFPSRAIITKEQNTNDSRQFCLMKIVIIEGFKGD